MRPALQASLMEQQSLTEEFSLSKRDCEIRSLSCGGGRPRRGQSLVSHGNLNSSSSSSPPNPCSNPLGGCARPARARPFAMGEIQIWNPFEQLIMLWFDRIRANMVDRRALKLGERSLKRYFFLIWSQFSPQITHIVTTYHCYLQDLHQHYQVHTSGL